MEKHLRRRPALVKPDEPLSLIHIWKIWAYAHEHWQTVGLFGVSMGAYIALAATANEPPAFAWLLSVSYTHLDVYKRQASGGAIHGGYPARRRRRRGRDDGQIGRAHV